MINQVKKSKKVVEIINLKKSFGNQVILQDISLSLMEGENLVILGKSGSGKSVLIKCLIGLLTTDSGQINVFEENMNTSTGKELALLREKIGFLFQSSALYDSMTVRQNLEFPLRRIKKNLTENQIEEKVNEVLENVGLIESINKMPSELSGGMRKRISLARTLVVDPKLMLYDEPTTGLDPITSNEISLLILDIQKKYKTSSIIITHDIKCTQKTANRIIMIEDGLIYKEGSLESFENESDLLIKSYFN
ncbi:ABC transporter ATP-binding protein [Flavobacterium sp.]|uniref:ABC transporter ATP-binding protein n=1 Tax=Flavobacterium sp. TaxID=239 RepID=UPI0025BA76D4|nr:ATP-binding cassette domain-containing protein [Flavobacterium sp.]MBA4155276.1 ABC transporter ATP-binding protein [Flavobacterium sp.]